jgi:ClpP class serine protease
MDDSGRTSKFTIGIIQLHGPLMKYDQDCGPMGMLSLTDIFKRNDNNPNLHVHILDIDSPGGTVAGTEEFGDAVRAAKKPTITIVRDLMGSAAVWVGTGSKEVYASKELDEVGSIGVMMSFADLEPYYERLGVKFHSIEAEQSKDKNKIYKDLKKGEYDEYRKTVLNPIADKFISVVKQSRPNVKDDQLTGKVFFARELVGTLIDGIKTFDQVVARAVELAESNSATQSKTASHQSLNNTMSKTFLNLNKAVGAELEVADGGVFLTEEQAALADTALVENEPDTTALAAVQTERDTAISERDAAITASDTATQTVADRDTRITELEAEVARLGRAPGASSAATVVETDVDATDSDNEFTMEMSMGERLAKLNQQKQK